MLLNETIPHNTSPKKSLKLQMFKKLKFTQATS